MSGKAFSRVFPRWEQTSRYTTGESSVQKRLFASSVRCQKDVPQFKPTSSLELDNIFSTFRENVFLPARLSNPHRKLIYGTRHKKDIELSPVTVDVGGEEFRLKHIDRTKDVPSQSAALKKMLKLMTKSDWDNFPAFLEGINIANRHVPAAMLEKSIRAAARADRLDVILECARRVSQTKFTIETRSIAKNLFYWVQYKALVENFNKARTAQSLRMAEQIAVLMENEEHAGGEVRENDARTSPEVTGFLLELSAINAKQQDGADKDGSVERYAKRFLSTIQGKDLEPLLDADHGRKHTDLAASNAILVTVVPILYGVKTAISVLDQSSETVTQLRQVQEKLEADVARNIETLRANGASSDLFGFWSYETVAALP